MLTVQEKLKEESNITYEELHESLWKYARWMSACNGNRGHWLLSKEDLYSEYLLVMYNCHTKYSSREGMTLEELMIICKSGMRNKFRSLLSRCFQTHRVAEKNTSELDEISNAEMPLGMDPSIVCDEKEVFAEIASNLNSFDAEVLDALLGNNERVGLFLDLHRRRMSFCLVEKDINISPHIIASALCKDESEIEESFDRIKMTLRKRNDFEYFAVVSDNELIWI